MRNLIFLLFASISAIAQINPTSFSKIKVINQTENQNATRVVVQDENTKEFHWVLKSQLGGGSQSLQQVLDVGNIATISQTSGVKAFEINSPQTVMSFFGDNILVSNSTQQFNTGLNGFLYKLNDNTRRIKFDLDGLEIKTGVSSGIGYINTNNLNGLRNYQFEDRTGTISVINKATLDTYISPRIQPNEDAIGWHVTKALNKAVGFSAENTDDINNGAIANITLKGSGAVYTNNTGLSHFGANYFIPYLRGNGALYSDKELNIIGAGTNSLVDIKTGSDIATATSKLKIAKDGKITIGVEPLTSNAETKILAYGTGGELKIVTRSQLSGTMPTVTNSTSLPANGTIPVGTIYFVSGTNQTFINTGTLWQEL